MVLVHSGGAGFPCRLSRRAFLTKIANFEKPSFAEVVVDFASPIFSRNIVKELFPIETGIGG
jgi:hypothetical protein